MPDVSINSVSYLYRILMDLNGTKLDSYPRQIIHPELFVKRLESELEVVMSLCEVKACGNFEDVANVVHRKLKLDFEGNTIPDLFGKLEQIAQVEIHKDVRLRWFTQWNEFDSLGNWLTSPDWLDYVEMFLRIDEEFGVKMGVTVDSLEEMPITVGETVKRIWQQRQPQTSKNGY
jgi:hypothetical protein